MGIERTKRFWKIRCDKCKKAYVKNSFPKISLSDVMKILEYTEINGKVCCKSCTQEERTRMPLFNEKK